VVPVPPQPLACYVRTGIVRAMAHMKAMSSLAADDGPVDHEAVAAEAETFGVERDHRQIQ
jgi:hypothetical protein